eukprot:2089341-Prymnesium_polylepis.1
MPIHGSPPHTPCRRPVASLLLDHLAPLRIRWAILVLAQARLLQVVRPHARAPFPVGVLGLEFSRDAHPVSRHAATQLGAPHLGARVLRPPR